MISREKTQAELARVVRLTTMGELVASIAHEIKQPLSGIITHAEAGLRWLNRDRPISTKLEVQCLSLSKTPNAR
jgi:C4-dicarboxylate-specific signal transduction histidine kinase